MLTEIHFRVACGFDNGGGTAAAESEEEGRPQVRVGRGNSGRSHRTLRKVKGTVHAGWLG